MTRVNPRVSVVLPAYYSDGTIAACLEAIEAQSFQDFEVIVVNSSPESRTSDIVTNRSSQVVFHQHPTRLLPHAARNVGVAMAKGELLVFTDPDCLPDRDWLALLVHATECGWPVVQGSVDLNGQSWRERGIHLCKRFSLLKGVPPYSPWIVSSINVCYSRAAWLAAGPLDGDLYCGDALLGWRAAALGFRAVFEPRAIVADSHIAHLRGLVRERYSRGREFAAVRSNYEQWGRWRATCFVLATPVLLALVLARAGRAAHLAGWAKEYLVTLPVQIAGHLAWILGETRCYAARAATGAA